MNIVDNTTVDDSIRNNSIISFDELKNHALSTIEKEKLTYLCNNIVSDSARDFIMQYVPSKKSLIINIDKSIFYAKNQLLTGEYRVSPLQRAKNRIDYFSEEYKINMINLFLIYYINHEVTHVKQYDAIEMKPEENMSRLLKACFDLAKFNPDSYIGHHDSYLTEYQANIYSGLMTLDEYEIKYKDIIGEKELEFFNMYLANEIIKRYWYNYFNELVSPIRCFKNLSKNLHFDKESYIESLENNESNEYNINDLLLGRKVSNDVLNEIRDISKGKVKSKNLFNTIYNK